jgi:hypothetical protein
VSPEPIDFEVSMTGTPVAPMPVLSTVRTAEVFPRGTTDVLPKPTGFFEVGTTGTPAAPMLSTIGTADVSPRGTTDVTDESIFLFRFGKPVAA